MVMKVLKNKLQILDSRRELIAKGVSSIDYGVRALLRRWGLVRGVVVGDHIKSWDVLQTLKFLEQHVRKNEPILDIGCYASEILMVMHKASYVNLSGADMNPALKQMPYQNSIRYENTNFLATPFSDSSFKAITSISVIEHGFDGQALLKEMSRLLQPGGYFIASFDYWPEKIDTTDIKFFEMDWLIFSKQEIAAFISQAATYGLVPIGDLDFAGQDMPIECAGKKYTFGWLVLTKMDSA